MIPLNVLSEKLQGLSVREVAAEIALRARRRVARAFSRLADDSDRSRLTDDDLRQALSGRSISEVARRLREGITPSLTPGLKDAPGTASLFSRLFPDSAEQIKQEASSILDHRFLIFGRESDLGDRIDWHADPSTAVRWPLLHFTRVPFKIERGSDVRAVWELNRLHHFVTLGQAYALTADERYTEEFLNQTVSWNEANPPRFGVNWTVPMEAGIRAINLIAALDLFRKSPLMTDDAFAMIVKLLLSHGRFISNNLEFSYRLTSNHYLSNLIGLFVLGSTLQDLDESGRWVEFSTGELLREMNKQVLADGVDYEGTTGYHRFVLEIFTLFYSLARTRGIELPGEHQDRLQSMFNFVRHYLKPDGTAPSIGDSDDGRLLRFKARPAADHSYLMSIGAVILETNHFKQTDEVDEECIWWFGEAGVHKYHQLARQESEPSSRGFVDSQIYVQRDGPLYALIDCGDHGALGRGSHAHSDALSIELFAFGQTFLRDPGTFAYTADEGLRDLFRSTAYHNTVRIDGREISPVREGQPFSLGRNVRPEILRWETTREADVLDAAHHSYTTLVEPVIHRRIVTFKKTEGYWTITDKFSGQGTHLLEYFFNLEPGLEPSIEAGPRVLVSGPNSVLAIVPSNLAPEIEIAEHWVSPAYGTRTPSSAIIFRFQAVMPFESTIALIPSRR